MNEGRNQGPGEFELATFGGGCFWCTEAVYRRVDGVVDATPGYAGGTTANPTYDDVTSGMTGHAEVVQLRFDPDRVSYEDLLRVFFATHDPTTLNRQGADFGTQYRSVVFVHDDAQREAVEATIRALEASDAYRSSIVTEIKLFETFWPAEAYHQDFYAKNPWQGYCRTVVAPKIDKLEAAFKNLVKRDNGRSG